MNNFFIMTRGRTGSTAITDELNKSTDLYVAQELFLNWEFNDSDFTKPGTERKVFPYLVWKDEVLPWKLLPKSLNNRFMMVRYLSYAEKYVQDLGCSHFGFKLLSHHFVEWPPLGNILRNRKYQCLYLRRNLSRLVISGMIARISGLYNTVGDTETISTYQLDPVEFKKDIHDMRNAISEDLRLLNINKFDFIIIDYEDFVEHRDSFFKNIFSFLEIPFTLPPKSDYKRIIKDLRQTIINYDEIVEIAAKIGYPIEK